MNILVTGGGGFLGFHICSLLKASGHEITSLSRSHYITLDTLEVKTILCDLSKKEDIECLDLSSFDAIIHTAALAGVWGDKDKYFGINYNGTVNLVNKAKECGVKYFIYTSTPSVVFGDTDINNGDENLPYADHFYTHYAHSKSLAEKYLLDACSEDFHAVAIRPHLIWGPGDPHLIPRVLAKAKLGKLKRVGDGRNQVDIIYVKNAALAHIQALETLVEKPEISGNAYFIGQEKPVYLWEFINDVLKRNKLEPIYSGISYKLAYCIGYLFEIFFNILGIMKPEPPMTRFVAMQLAKNHYFSHDKAANDFGYKPKYTIEDALEETYPMNSEA